VPTTKTVIVADDTAFVRDRFATALLGAGHTALTVKSAAELLARVRGDLDRIDLILLDLRLPHAGGVELVRSVRKLDHGKVPIIVFSGTIANADEVRELAALGVAGYVNEYSAVQHILPSLAPHLFPDNFNRRGSPRVVLGIAAWEWACSSRRSATTIRRRSTSSSTSISFRIEKHEQIRTVGSKPSESWMRLVAPD
jgi:CheY-like chemotaxis protein